MKQSFKFIIGFILVSVTINNCQKENAFQLASDDNETIGSHRYNARIAVEPIWTRLGDRLGSIDKEMGNASVDISEFSKSSQWIASGASGSYDLKVWRVSDGICLWSFQCENQIESVCFSPDEDYLLAGGKFKKLIIWKTEDWSMAEQIEFETSIECIRFSHDGKLIAFGKGNGEISIMTYPGFGETAIIKHTKSENFFRGTGRFRADVNSIDFSKDDEFLISGGMDGFIRIWETNDFKMVQKLEGHDGSIKSVRINSTTGLIASASVAKKERKENSIKIWNFNTGELIHTLSFPMGMEAVEFTSDGKYLIGGGMEGKRVDSVFSTQGHLYIYSIPENLDNQPVMQVRKIPVFRSEYLHINDDGNFLVSSHQDGTVRLWNIKLF